MHTTITTKTAYLDPFKTVDVIKATLNGKLAVHKSIDERGYTITHVPTGHAFRTRIRNKREAIKVMLDLENAADWNFRVPHSPKWKAIKDKIFPLVAHLRQYSMNRYRF